MNISSFIEVFLKADKILKEKVKTMDERIKYFQNYREKHEDALT